MENTMENTMENNMENNKQSIEMNSNNIQESQEIQTIASEFKNIMKSLLGNYSSQENTTHEMENLLNLIMNNNYNKDRDLLDSLSNNKINIHDEEDSNIENIDKNIIIIDDGQCCERERLCCEREICCEGEVYEDKNVLITQNKRVNQMINIHNEALELFIKKNRDYGDSFATYGPIGVIVRMGDKIQRLVSVSKSGVTFVNNESLRDTLIDLHNYSAMAIMLIDEEHKS